MSKKDQAKLGEAYSSSLSERQEILLSRYFDKESGWLDSYRAERLVATKPQAAAFLNMLSDLHGSVTAESSITIDPQVTNDSDFWNRINMRIEQEERSNVFFGDRALDRPAKPWGQMFGSRGIFVGGLSSAAACVLVVFSVWPTGRIYINVNRPSAVASNNVSTSTEISNASYSDDKAEKLDSSEPRRPVMLNDHTQQAMEVDWMRGNGRVRFIQAPQDRSAIIWVKRKPQAKNNNDRPLIVDRSTLPLALQTP